MEDILNNYSLNVDNYYHNVLLHTGINQPHGWNNNIALENDKIILHSNSFLWEHLYFEQFYIKFQNNNYKIYDNIIRNYIILKQTNCEDIIEEPYFCMMNPFVYKNVGHDIACLLSQLEYVLKNNLKILLFIRIIKKVTILN
jgi:hypothetical protein